MLAGIEHQRRAHRSGRSGRCRRRARAPATPASPAIWMVRTMSCSLRGITTPERFDLVDRGVGAVAPARAGVEQHLALQLAAQANRNVPGRQRARLCEMRRAVCGFAFRANAIYTGPTTAGLPPARTGISDHTGGAGVSGRHFLQIPGPTNVPRARAAGDGHPDHGPPRSGIRRAQRWRSSPASSRYSKPAAR